MYTDRDLSCARYNNAAMTFVKSYIPAKTGFAGNSFHFYVDSCRLMNRHDDLQLDSRNLENPTCPHISRLVRSYSLQGFDQQ